MQRGCFFASFALVAFNLSAGPPQQPRTFPPGLSAPAVIYKQEPKYTREARQAKVSGTVVLRVVVSEEGKAQDIKVIRPLGYGLDEMAIEAVEAWRFRPGTKDGRPVLMVATIEVNFRLLENGQRPISPVIPISATDPLDASLPPPKLTSPADDAVFDTYPRQTTCRWEPSPGADTYLLEWDYSDDGVWNAEGKHLPGAGHPVQGTEFTFDFVGAQPGRWRVWPVNTKGKRGTPSEWRTFRYTR